MAEALLDIADVAEQSGLAASALRFYERRGLIAPAGRNGLRRAYRPDVLGRLALIACARGAGFTIAEIARFLVATPDDTALRARMADKARELEDDIARLARMRDSLRHAATCTHEPLVECPEFKRSFEDPASAAGHPAQEPGRRPPPPARRTGATVVPDGDGRRRSGGRVGHARGGADAARR